jgi:hypothetical protein
LDFNSLHEEQLLLIYTWSAMWSCHPIAPTVGDALLCETSSRFLTLHGSLICCYRRNAIVYSISGHIVAVDSVSPTVFCIAESGDLLRWFDCSDYMREPSDIAIDGKEYFVCDFKVSPRLSFCFKKMCTKNLQVDIDIAATYWG